MKNFVTQNQSITSKRIIGLVAFAFLITFAASRLVVYLVLGHLMPNLFLTVKGVHIHHFTYGVVILCIVGLYLLLRRPPAESDAFRWSALFYGVGLGLTFDEFGMWVRLEDNYWMRQSYDAIVIVILILLNIAYYKFVPNVLNVLFVRQIKKLINVFKLK
ncbi:MAG: hypothetical protein WCX97_00925 [Candidatus Magasanikbacteria bacterium]